LVPKSALPASHTKVAKKYAGKQNLALTII
jgi:hypothetical protein